MHRRDMLKTAAVSLAVAGCGTGSQTQSESARQSSKPILSPEMQKQAEIDQKKHQILMLIYPKFTTLDLIGPQHVFSLLGPEFKTRLVWKDTTDEIVSDTGVPVRATQAFRDCTDAPMVLFIPGGTDGTLAAMEDPEVREFVATRGTKAKFVTSVCTGALVLGAAGLLKGYKATTHWLAIESLAKFGAEHVPDRVVIDRNRVTGAGVTAGIDFALTLAAQLKDESYAKAIQLMMEYDPKPPFNSGNPEVAEPESVTMLRAMTIPFLRHLDDICERLQP